MWSASEKKGYDDCWIRDEDDENDENDAEPNALLARVEPWKFSLNDPPLPPPLGVVHDPEARRGFSGVRKSRGPMSTTTHETVDSNKKGKDLQENDSEGSSNSGTFVD